MSDKRQRYIVITWGSGFVPPTVDVCDGIVQAFEVERVLQKQGMLAQVFVSLKPLPQKLIDEWKKSLEAELMEFEEVKK